MLGFEDRIYGGFKSSGLRGKQASYSLGLYGLQ